MMIFKLTDGNNQSRRRFWVIGLIFAEETGPIAPTVAEPAAIYIN